MASEVKTTFRPASDMEAQIGATIAPAVDRWGERAAADAQRTVKVDTGATKQSIGHRTVRDGAVPRAQIFATSEGAYWLETGEGHGPPQPFLRPAAFRVAGNPT
jgi:hypothetical protein